MPPSPTAPRPRDFSRSANDLLAAAANELQGDLLHDETWAEPAVSTPAVTVVPASPPRGDSGRDRGCGGGGRAPGPERVGARARAPRGAYRARTLAPRDRRPARHPRPGPGRTGCRRATAARWRCFCAKSRRRFRSRTTTGSGTSPAPTPSSTTPRPRCWRWPPRTEPREPPHRHPPAGFGQAWTDEALTEQVRAVLAASPFTGEGYRKVWARLRLAGVRNLEGPGAAADAGGGTARPDPRRASARTADARRDDHHRAA